MCWILYLSLANYLLFSKKMQVKTSMSTEIKIVTYSTKS